MSVIRKYIWTIITILLIASLIFGISTFKKHYTIKQIKDLPKQEEVLQEEVETEQEIEEEQTDEDSQQKEDPVKEFISEKAEKAMKRLFTKELKIVAIGDSLTEGVGDETGNGGYVGILTDTINQDRDLIDTKNFGKNGNRSDQLLARMDDPEIEAALDEADMILITIGANDIMEIFKDNFTDLTMDKFTTGKLNYEKRLNKIFTMMEDMNHRADIYLIGFYNPFKQYFADIEELEIIIQNWNTIGKEVTEKYDDVHYIPTGDLFEDTSINYLSDDQFHPNHLGYELMAERILEYITNEGDPIDIED